jgi:uncharacterized protein YgiB involved in biofilm formation
LKRSEYIALGAIGLLAVAAFWPRNVTSVGGSTQDEIGPDAQAFATLDECRAAAGMTAQACDTAFANARQAADANAPRFNSQTSCEAQYGAGQCRSSTWNGSSVFVPALVGALVARSLAGAQPQGQPLYPPRIGPAACPQGVSTPNRPECAQRSGGSGSTGGGWSSGRYYSTGGGATVSRAPGADARVRVDARPRSVSTPGTAMPSGGTVARNGFGSTGRGVSSGT